MVFSKVVHLCLFVVTFAASDDHESTEEACALQLRPPVVMVDANEESCSVGESVKCPGSGNWCAGNQCCPRSTFGNWNDGKTFPCPSADPAWESQCESPHKQEDCVDAPGRPCCRGLTADCLACAADVSVEEYCAENPGTAGCPSPKACCLALTADCLACAADMSVEEYCAENPETAGCPSAQPCCRAQTVDCLACAAQMSTKDYCAVKPETVGCPSLLEMTIKEAVCSIGEDVKCPGSGNWCAGNQCCPRSTFGNWNDGKTFPCPSADPAWESQCESPHKQEDCVSATQKPCCLGLTADCLACAADVSVEEYCAENPGTAGCPSPKACCLALTADCLACAADLSVEEYCAENPDTAGCPSAQPCCRAQTAECLACVANMSVEDYCVANPTVSGCFSLKAR